MPGFVFWGLFAVCGLVVVAYGVWMRWVEREPPAEGSDGDPAL